jgi:hypothetical protein
VPHWFRYALRPRSLACLTAESAAMTRIVALNGLFLLAGCTSSLASEALYRITLVIIVLLLHAWWARAMVQRAFDKRTVVRDELIRLGSGNASRRITPIHISHKNK